MEKDIFWSPLLLNWSKQKIISWDKIEAYSLKSFVYE